MVILALIMLVGKMFGQILQQQCRNYQNQHDGFSLIRRRAIHQVGEYSPAKEDAMINPTAISGGMVCDWSLYRICDQ
jgi:hypothetical protein